MGDKNHFGYAPMCGRSSVVERLLPKQDVASSNLVARSNCVLISRSAALATLLVCPRFEKFAGLGTGSVDSVDAR